MGQIIKSIQKEKFSRRNMILKSGIMAIGATLGTSIISGCTKKGFAQTWEYKKLDPDEVGEIAYNSWYEGYCSYAVVSGIFKALAKNVGEPYSSFPLDAIKWGHGGGVGWGTLCGTLTATGIVTGFIARKEGEKIFNDLIGWYAEANLPIFKPKNPRAKIKNRNVSKSPLCHISVAKWSSKEGVDFFSKQRRDRCARVSADVAMQTARLLNARLDGTYKPTFGNQVKKHKTTAQDNCKECHK